MNPSEIKKLLISSLESDADPIEVSNRLEEEGVTYNFSKSFSDRVIDRVFSTGLIVTHEVEYVKNLSFAFYRIALTGIAAIVLLLISIFLMEGSITFNSLLGLSNSHDESIVCLLTGN